MNEVETSEYSIKEFARLHGLHPRTIQRYIEKGKLTIKRVVPGGRITIIAPTIQKPKNLKKYYDKIRHSQIL